MQPSTQETSQTLLGMRYPAAGLKKFLFRLPLGLWRVGLGWLLPRNLLVLTTSGRKSGEPRHTMVEHWEIDGDYYIVSGWGKQAQWLKNLQADPIVTVQTVRHGAVTGKAERVLEDERLARFYKHAAGSSPVWKPYLDSLGIDDTLQDVIAKKERLSLVCIQPVDQIGPAALPVNRAGVWFLVGLGLLWQLRRG